MQNKAETLAAKLAATANPANNAPEAERAVALEKLRAHCAKHGLDFAAYAPFAASQAEPEPEATEQPAQPSADGARAKRRERVASTLASIRKLYAGASPSFRRSGKPHAFGIYADTVTTPRQSIGPNGPSERDDSGLAGLLLHADADGIFCPTALCVDLGVISRLASVGFLAVNGDKLAFTETGLARANGARARA